MMWKMNDQIWVPENTGLKMQDRKTRDRKMQDQYSWLKRRTGKCRTHERRNTQTFLLLISKVSFVPYRNSTFPVLYVLMSCKSQALYQKVFDTLKNLMRELTPTDVMADLDDASVLAFWNVYGITSTSGCWFHYTQAIVKRVQKLGLKEAYYSKD